MTLYDQNSDSVTWVNDSTRVTIFGDSDSTQVTIFGDSDLTALFFDWSWIKNNPKHLKIKMYSVLKAFLVLMNLFLVLGSKSLNGTFAKLHTVAASNNRDHPTRSLFYCFLFFID